MALALQDRSGSQPDWTALNGIKSSSRTELPPLQGPLAQVFYVVVLEIATAHLDIGASADKISRAPPEESFAAGHDVEDHQERHWQQADNVVAGEFSAEPAGVRVSAEAPHEWLSRISSLLVYSWTDHDFPVNSSSSTYVQLM